jgi:hypothetical protein
VHRRYSSRMQQTIYDRYRPEVDIDVRSLKAIGEPRGISPKRQETTAVNITELTGIFVLSETLLQIRQPGTPRSREKAPEFEVRKNYNQDPAGYLQNCREVVANTPVTAQMPIMIMIVDIMQVPAIELVPW